MEPVKITNNEEVNMHGTGAATRDESGHPEVIVYGHSSLFYFWPVWLVGYIMAAITFWSGETHTVAGERLWFYADSNVGVIYIMTLFLVILITNILIRGMAGVVVILSIVLLTVLLALFNLWDTVLTWFGDLKVQINLGTYFWFSTLMFVTWVISTFVIDRMSWWSITPGQVTHVWVLGVASKSYDTENLVLEKIRDDFFRHWVLGFGSGDLSLKPYGAQREEILIPNVLFIGSIMHEIEHMVATEPSSFGHAR